MTEFCRIPEAMALQILSRLPPKSLMRFKCVHKSWHTLMKDPNFVAKHHSYSMLNNLNSVLIKRVKDLPNAAGKKTETRFSLISISNANGDVEHDHDTHCLVEDVRDDQFSGFEILESASIIGHCHGIICLRNDMYTKVILWNPAIREVKVTSPYVPDKKLSDLGIGYDPKSNTYKVVHISYSTHEKNGDEHVHVVRPKTEVYTIGTDSWRQIMTASLETETIIFRFLAFHMYFNGVCYWKGCEQPREFQDFYDLEEEEYIMPRPVIMSFDMSEEVFHNMLLPDFVYDQTRYTWNYVIHLWNECVAIFGVDHGVTDHESWGLWVMGDSGGVTGSWIKQFSFVITEGIFYDVPLQFWKSDELLFVSEERCFVSYNLYTKQFKHLPVHGMDFGYYEAVVYMNSMVSVNGSNRFV